MSLGIQAESGRAHWLFGYGNWKMLIPSEIAHHSDFKSPAIPK
jgi:hypothetical protein